VRRQSWVIFLLLCPLLLQAGCAGHLFHAVETTEDETRRVGSAFNEMLERSQQCSCCLDAEVKIVFALSKWFGGRSVAFSGYLLAKRPSFLKFVGVNPLGQPLFILATDGERFHSIHVSEAKAYEGEVRSKTFLKYFPSGIGLDSLFFWLTGRTDPNGSKIRTISRDTESGAYWVDVSLAQGTGTDWVLYDPVDDTLRRHIHLDGRKEVLLDVSYEDYLESDSGCLVPAKITANAPELKGSIELILQDVLTNEFLPDRDFDYEVPAGFEIIKVE